MTSISYNKRQYKELTITSAPGCNRSMSTEVTSNNAGFKTEDRFDVTFVTDH